MRELSANEIYSVEGAGILAKTGDVLSAAALPMGIFGPEASFACLLCAGFYYAASAAFE